MLNVYPNGHLLSLCSNNSFVTDQPTCVICSCLFMIRAREGKWTEDSERGEVDKRRESFGQQQNG